MKKIQPLAFSLQPFFTFLLGLVVCVGLGCKSSNPANGQAVPTSTIEGRVTTSPTPGPPTPETPAILDPETIAALAALEVSHKPKNRIILQELSTALDVFCGSQQIDSLALITLFKSKFAAFSDHRRVAMLLLLLDRAGAQINPSDYVQWGGLACKLRRGISLALTLSE